MTPDAVEEKYGVTPGAVPRPRRTGGRARATTCPASRAWGRRRPRSGSTSSATLDDVVARVDEITGKAGEALRDAPRRRDPQPPDQRAGSRPRRSPVEPDDLAAQPWDRDEVHQVFDGLEFRVLRDRLFATLDRRRAARPRAASRSTARVLAPARSPAGWPSTHRRRRAHRRARRRAAGARGTGDVAALALATAPTARRLGRPGELTPDDEAALAAWLADADRAEGAARREGTDARAARPAAGTLAGLTSDTALSAYLALPTSAATTWPT